MKFYLLILLAALPLFASSQEIQLDEKDGVVLTYKLTKLKEDGKKDTYLAVCKATNKNDYDVFYETPNNKVNPFFSIVNIRNGNSFIYLTGTESRLFTKDKILFYLKKGGSVSSEKEFKIDKGVVPILTNEFAAVLKTITDVR